MKTLSNIMLIDDNEADNEFHRIVIEKSGCAEQIHAFSNTTEALSYLKNCIETSAPVPDLIFLDILMPRIDGFEWLTQLKNLLSGKPELKQKVKVVMLSGNYDPVMEIYLNSPSYDDMILGYRLKPLTAQMLSEILEKHF